jgi:threonine/homoserine/homoserine lactone efflux protein
MIEAIITGIGFGLVLSVLTGPVFFALIKTSIEKGFHAGVAMALGVVTSDMVFIGGILFGSQLFDFKVNTTILGIVGSAILFTIGIYYIFQPYPAFPLDNRYRRGKYVLPLRCTPPPA